MPICFMGHKVDLIGKRFSKLLVVAEHGRGKQKSVLWLCRCDCGKDTIVDTRQLNSGKTKSCGCIIYDILLKRNLTHGKAKFGQKTPEYRTWLGMKGRCNNKNSGRYKNYGGRGITVCDRWINSFENFLNDMGQRPSNSHSIHRKDENGNYEPDNCVWATNFVQARGRTDNVWVEYKGDVKIQEDWCIILGIRASQMNYHLSKGRTIDYLFEKFGGGRC
jgi:hypothetical protein